MPNRLFLTPFSSLAAPTALLAAVLFTACGKSDGEPLTEGDTHLGGAAGASAGGTDSGGSNTGGSDSGGSNTGGSATGGSAGATNTVVFAIGGTVTGLSGSGLVLRNNDGDELEIDGDGTFVFDGQLEEGEEFDVTIANQPDSPPQTCSVSGGKGTVGDDNVTSIMINCEDDAYTLGGTVSGLAGSGLVLRTADGDEVAVGADGEFAFPIPITPGASYAVSVKSQPMGLSQTCVVANESGTMGEGNVTDVGVTCSTNSFTVGATVSGLTGSGLALQNDGGDDLAVSSDGAVTFATPLIDGSSFDVAVLSQPTDPLQTCAVAGGSGTLMGADVTSIAVNCTTDSFTIGGTVSGLAGTGLVLQNSGGDDLAISANGDFAFTVPVDDLDDYDVTVLGQPTGVSQTCTVSGGTGSVAQSDVTDVAITCTTNTYTVGGTVSGLEGSGLVLQNNGGDELAVDADGSFEMPTAIESGQSYLVTVLTQPTGKSQTCSVTSGSGSVTNADVTDVSITCTTSSFTVGGSVSGLTSGSLVLTNNGGDDVTIDADGPFTFDSAVESGSSYDVALKAAPGDLSCSVLNGSGTIGDAPVTNVTVSCAERTGGDDFESSDTSAWTTMSSTYTIEVIPEAAANGSSNGLQLTGGNNGHYNGLRYDITPCPLTRASIWMQADDTTSTVRNYIVIGDDNTTNNNGVVFLAAEFGDWSAHANGTWNDIHPVTPGEWVFFEFEFDWTTKDVDISANGVLIADNLNFRAQSDSISQVHLYSWGDAVSRYDEFYYECPAE